MSIEVKEIVRRYRYNGVTLPDVAGMSPKEIRDLYSAQYPELIARRSGRARSWMGCRRSPSSAPWAPRADMRLAAFKARVEEEAIAR